MFVINDEMKSLPAGEGCTRKIMSYSDEMMIVEVSFEKGAIGAPHAHPHIQASYVLEGEFTVTVGDSERHLKAGDTFLAKGDEVHGVVALTEGKLLDVFTPCRLDFVKQLEESNIE